MTLSNDNAHLESMDSMDEHCIALYLEVPGSQIVKFQATFEIYEAVAISRTLSVTRSMVCLLTTPDMLNDCLAILESIRHNVNWRWLPKPSAEDRELYHGYTRKARKE